MSLSINGCWTSQSSRTHTMHAFHASYAETLSSSETYLLGISCPSVPWHIQWAEVLMVALNAIYRLIQCCARGESGEGRCLFTGSCCSRCAYATVEVYDGIHMSHDRRTQTLRPSPNLLETGTRCNYRTLITTKEVTIRPKWSGTQVGPG